MSTTFKDHEKFIAFFLLGLALMSLAVMLYIRPLPANAANNGVLQILNMIIGAFIGAFGAAAGKLFDARVTVDNAPTDPIPVTADQTTPAGVEPLGSAEVPDYAR